MDQIAGSLAEPFVFIATRGPSNLSDSILQVVIDGEEARTAAELMDRFATEFEFPDYFGRNWNAFYDCLADLDWCPPTGYVVVIRNADAVLADEPLHPEFPILASSYADCFTRCYAEMISGYMARVNKRFESFCLPYKPTPSASETDCVQHSEILVYWGFVVSGNVNSPLHLNFDRSGMFDTCRSSSGCDSSQIDAKSLCCFIERRINFTTVPTGNQSICRYFD